MRHTYIITLDEYKSIGTPWVALCLNEVKVIYSDGFGVEDIKKLIEKKNIIKNIYPIRTYDWIIRGYFFIGFINFLMKGKWFVRLY